MKIELNPEEYNTLLMVLEISDWVLHAFTDDEPQSTRDFRNLEQKLLRYATDFGRDEFVEYDEEQGDFMLSEAFRKSSPGIDFIGEYDDNTFWEELTERLAYRDLSLKEGEIDQEAVDPYEFTEKMTPYMEKYSQEFNDHGIDRLEIRE
ncbi:MAG: hypothetical protein JW861_03340 [Bacteroidales bacterium]|nr:hypothetical protein [Bacteroidales bacterium]